MLLHVNYALKYTNETADNIESSPCYSCVFESSPGNYLDCTVPLKNFE